MPASRTPTASDRRRRRRRACSRRSRASTTVRSPSTSRSSRPRTTGCAPRSPTPGDEPAGAEPTAPTARARAAPPPARRRAGPPRAGPLARARRRADRRRPGAASRRRRHQAGHRGDHRRRRSWCADDPDRPDYVSRGGHKLAGALAAFEPLGLDVAGRRCLDAGASTGGFTDVLLRAGAAEVVAVDVGYGQLAWSLRSDDRVRGARPHQRPRRSTPELIGGPVDLVVGDLSFISLRAGARPRWSACTARRRRPGADGEAAVRGRQGAGRQGRRGPRPGAAGRGGRDGGRGARPARGWGARAVTASPLPGPVGQRRVLPVAAPRRRARSTEDEIARRGASRPRTWGCRVRGWSRDRPPRRPERCAASWCSRTPGASEARDVARDVLPARCTSTASRVRLLDGRGRRARRWTARRRGRRRPTAERRRRLRARSW